MSTQKTIKLSEHYLKKTQLSSTISDNEEIAATPKAVKSAYDLANGKPNLGTGQNDAARGNHTHNDYISKVTGSNNILLASGSTIEQATFLKTIPPHTNVNGTDIGKATTLTYGHTKLYDNIDSENNELAATANSVQIAYNKANHDHPYASLTHDHDGKYIKTGTGTITSTNIANGTIVDEDINANANIATSKIDGLNTILENKVDKIDGKSLSTYDFDLTYKNRVDNLVSSNSSIKNAHIHNASDVTLSQTYSTHNIETEITNMYDEIHSKPNLGTGQNDAARGNHTHNDYITKDVNNLTNYTTTTNINTALDGKSSIGHKHNSWNSLTFTINNQSNTILDQGTANNYKIYLYYNPDIKMCQLCLGGYSAILNANYITLKHNNDKITIPPDYIPSCMAVGPAMGYAKVIVVSNKTATSTTPGEIRINTATDQLDANETRPVTGTVTWFYE